MELDCRVTSASIDFPIFETGRYLISTIYAAPYGKSELLLFLRGHSSIRTIKNSPTNCVVGIGARVLSIAKCRLVVASDNVDQIRVGGHIVRMDRHKARNQVAMGAAYH